MNVLAGTPNFETKPETAVIAFTNLVPADTEARGNVKPFHLITHM